MPLVTCDHLDCQTSDQVCTRSSKQLLDVIQDECVCKIPVSCTSGNHVHQTRLSPFSPTCLANIAHSAHLTTRKRFCARHARPVHSDTKSAQIQRTSIMHAYAARLSIQQQAVALCHLHARYSTPLLAAAHVSSESSTSSALARPDSKFMFWMVTSRSLSCSRSSTWGCIRKRQ